jgi:hypothetical protein
MTILPDHFEICRIKVEAAQFGTLGTIVGLLYHYPHWIGILEPALAFDDWQEELCNRFEYEDLDIQLQDLVSGEAWSGKMCDLTLPEPDYPWYELMWRDDRTLPSLSREIGQKVKSCFGRLLSGIRGWPPL